LTIVVIGISVVLGALLGGLDMVLSYIYRLIAP
jgi:preprotein translocase subunit SecE